MRIGAETTVHSAQGSGLETTVYSRAAAQGSGLETTVYSRAAAQGSGLETTVYIAFKKVPTPQRCA